MIRGIKFVNVPVTNQNEAVKFYTQKLGFRVLTDQPFDDKQRWIELGIPGRADLVVSHEPDHLLRKYQHPDLHKAINEAFRIAERQLQRVRALPCDRPARADRRRAIQHRLIQVG